MVQAVRPSFPAESWGTPWISISTEPLDWYIHSTPFSSRRSSRSLPSRPVLPGIWGTYRAWVSSTIFITPA